MIEKYNKLTVLSKFKKGARVFCLCLCDCGNTSRVSSISLKRGTTTQCRKCGHKSRNEKNTKKKTAD